MNNRNLHFKGQMENEEVITFFRKHWIVLLPYVIPFALMIAIISIFALNLSHFVLPTIAEPFFQIMLAMATIAVVYMTHRFFMHMIDYFLNVVIITNMRVVDIRHSLFTQDDKQSIDMEKIQDIQKQQEGLVKNFIHFGELNITLSAAEPVILALVPNPDYHFRLLNRLRKGEISRPGNNEQMASGDGSVMMPGRFHQTLRQGEVSNFDKNSRQNVPVGQGNKDVDTGFNGG